MRELTTEIEIAASPSSVWRVLTDFARYGEWNPFIQAIDGDAKVGATLKVQMTAPGGRKMTFKPRVLAADENRELRWKGRLLVPGIFDGEHRFVIEPRGSGVRFVQAERFSGILIPLAWRSIDRDVRQSFEALNRALKARAEQRASG